MALDRLLELIFQNKNKAYGAYILRKAYSKHLLHALIFVNILMGGLFGLYFVLLQNNQSPKEIYVSYKSDLYSETEVKIPEFVVPKAESSKLISDKNEKSVKNLPPEVSKEKISEPSEVEKSDVKADTASLTNATSMAHSEIKSISQDTTGAELYSNEIYFKVDSPAMFPGGNAALDSFVVKNLIYPEYAILNKINGIVYLQILVSHTGAIEEIKIDRGIESTCNLAVLNVMKQSPKWIPALKEGKKVKQRLIVPIKFGSSTGLH
ncbi:MAG: energy transducer TonB [Bacteroidota bacterium]|nr:energy transducer TonB [Bacteroidota bacterium]